MKTINLFEGLDKAVVAWIPTRSRWDGGTRKKKVLEGVLEIAAWLEVVRGVI